MKQGFWFKLEDLAASLNAVVSGMKLPRYVIVFYLIDVLIRAEAEQRASLWDSLSTLQISTPSGKKVPLMQVATIEYEQEYPLIWRRDRPHYYCPS